MSEETAVAVRQQPNLAPQSYQEMEEYAAKICNSSFCPKDFRGKPGDVMVAVQYGAEIGLAPLQALQNIAVINGHPSVWGDALMALAQSHPACEYINETFDDATMTAKCESKRSGAIPKIALFSQADAETAGLWGKDIWRKYPKRMLQMRARSFNLRDNFSDALKGLIAREEAQDFIEINPGAPIPAASLPPDELAADEISSIEEAMERSAQEGTLAEWWEADGKAVLEHASQPQRHRINNWKDELKEKYPEQNQGSGAVSSGGGPPPPPSSPEDNLQTAPAPTLEGAEKAPAQQSEPAPAFGPWSAYNPPQKGKFPIGVPERVEAWCQDMKSEEDVQTMSRYFHEWADGIKADLLDKAGGDQTKANKAGKALYAKFKALGGLDRGELEPTPSGELF